MPTYTYHCPANAMTLEVEHSMSETLKTWEDLCRVAGHPLGDTPADAEIKRLLHVPNINMPTGDSKLKEKGFTKLVRREKGVYENVTATGSEQRYMKADDPSTYPDFQKKISD